MLPNVASINSYGGPKQDFSAPSDSFTDRSATGVNPAYGDVAAMTHTIARSWARLLLSHTGATPTLVAHDEIWNNGNASNTAPVPARSSAGVFTLTYPASVVDEIPPTSQGYIGPQPINFRDGWGNVRGAVGYLVQVTPTAANVLTVQFFAFVAGVPTLADPTADTTIAVYGI